MARNREPILKTCRSLDISPTLLGIYKESHRGKVAPQRRKRSEYAIQLREKQRVKFVYGVLEKQFFLAFNRALKMEGLTGENLLVLMELRLDNVVFRLNLTETRRQARQVVAHGHILVNGSRVDIPSYQVKVGDVISIQEKSRKSELFANIKERARIAPAWLSAELEQMSGAVLRLPVRDDIDLPIDESLIVEFYSK